MTQSDRIAALELRIAELSEALVKIVGAVNANIESVANLGLSVNAMAQTVFDDSLPGERRVPERIEAMH